MENNLEFIELVKQSDEINALVEANYIDPTERSSPITDGIVKIEAYLMAKFKILWILKEPYDEVENGYAEGGGWSFPNDFLSQNGFYDRIKQSHGTWHPIIYTTYGILNGFLQWDQMDYIRDDKSMADIVQNIAVINVKKLPGLTRTNGFKSIQQAYDNNRDILLRQIDAYKPDIIIGGSTMPLFFADLGINSNSDLKSFGSLKYAERNNKLFLDVHHPGQTQMAKEIYINDIINCVKQWDLKSSTGVSI